MVLQNMTLFRKLTWVYVIVGVGALGVVAIAGQTSYGAKLSLSIGPLTIQPSEFVKIIFVMFIASMLYQRQDFHQVMVTSIFSAVFVLMLVASKDLGGALFVFFYLPGYGLCGDAQICVFRRWNTGNDRGESAWVPAV